MLTAILEAISSERAARLATTVAALVAIIAFGLGYLQFKETQVATRQTLNLQSDMLRHERETKAIELFIKFNELQRELAGKALPKKSEALFWQYNMLLALTESVFRLTQGDQGWYETVRWMLKTQRSFLESTPQGCRTFNTTFVQVMREEAPRMVCE
jgi:hypothetical protein